MTLEPELLRRMDAYWRAANYLSVGQIYLYDNPLLKRPLQLSDIKRMLLGHWGTVPGQNFAYVHLNRVIKKYDLDMIFVSGPGHGGPAVVGNTYLKGTYSEVYPDISRDEAGLRRVFPLSAAAAGAGGGGGLRGLSRPEPRLRLLLLSLLGEQLHLRHLRRGDPGATLERGAATERGRGSRPAPLFWRCAPVAAGCTPLSLQGSRQTGTPGSCLFFRDPSSPPPSSRARSTPAQPGCEGSSRECASPHKASGWAPCAPRRMRQSLTSWTGFFWVLGRAPAAARCLLPCSRSPATGCGCAPPPGLRAACACIPAPCLCARIPPLHLQKTLLRSPASLAAPPCGTPHPSPLF